MGSLFKSDAFRAAAAVGTGGLSEVANAATGGGLFGRKGGPGMFGADFGGTEKAINFLSDKFRPAEAPTEITASAQAAIDKMDADLTRQSGVLASSSLGKFQQMQSEISRQGLDSGSRERLSRATAQEAQRSQQELASKFGEGRAEIRVGDLASQEQKRFQTAMALPGMQLGLDQAINAQNAAEFRAKMMLAAKDKQMLGNIGSLAGMGAGAAIGFAAGGPMGAGIGAGIGGGAGSGLFSSFG